VQNIALADDPPRFAGPTAKGFLLPNGWTITPVDKQVTLTDLPLNIIPLGDGKHALAATSGYNKHELALVDLAGQKVIHKEAVRQSWFGLVLDGKANRIWWSGGGGNMVHAFELKDYQLVRTGEEEPDPVKLTTKIKDALQKKHYFKSGLALDGAKNLLYSLNINAGTIAAMNLTDGSDKTVACGRRPYDVAMARAGRQLFVSDWAARTVLVVNPDDLRTLVKIPVGEHPNQIAVHPKDDRVFVACASSNCVSVIDTKSGIVTETVYTAFFPRAPEGSTPDAVAIAPDGKTLYVANADNNCVVVIDVSVPDKSQVKGFIPTGWYPTAVAVTPDSKTLLVGVGKGNQTRPNPIFKKKKWTEQDPWAIPFPYIGTTLSGALSIVPVPDEKELIEYTATVYRNCPYSDKLLSGAPYPHKTAIPRKVGAASPTAPRDRRKWISATTIGLTTSS